MKQTSRIAATGIILAIGCAVIWFVGPHIVISGSAPLETTLSRLVMLTGVLISGSTVAVAMTAGETVSRHQAVDVSKSPLSDNPSVALEDHHMRSLGCFGHSIHQRDVVHINLPTLFVTAWNDWAKQLMLDGEARFGHHWIRTYDNSTYYRFILSAGIMGENAWAGVMVPSRNRVGECLPLCFAAYLPVSYSPMESIDRLSGWFESIEELASDVLDSEFAMETLADRLSQLSRTRVMLRERSQVRSQFMEDRSRAAGPVAIRMSSSDSTGAEPEWPELLDAVMTQTFFQYSLWMTSTSMREKNQVTLVSSALPLGDQGIALFSGEWHRVDIDSSTEESIPAVSRHLPDVSTVSASRQIDTAEVNSSALHQEFPIPDRSDSSQAGHTRLITPASRTAAASRNDQSITKPWKL